MSESKGETLSTTAANAPSSNQNQLWAKFYLSACVLLTKTKETLDNKDSNKSNDSDKSNEDLMKLHQKIMITLDTTTKLIFGLGATKKAQVVVHGGGAIELIIALVRASKVLEVNNGSDDDNENNGDNDNDNNAATALSKPIVLSSLKAIKTCVLRNPAGRCRCRSAGVFAYLKDVLDVILGCGEKKEGDESGEEKVADPEDKLLVEQVFTALAAICLGDDLNAVQASTQFKPFMERTKSIHCDEEHESSLGQKIQYLERLFTTIDEEQSELLTYLQSKKSNDNGNGNGNGNDSYQTFIENINNAEINIRNGYSALQSKNYQQSRNHYNQSLKLISPYIEYTKLFHPLVIEIRSKRGEVCYEMGKADECLVDTTYLLEQERLGDSAPMIMIKVLKLHAKGLTKVGRDEEAKESLGKLSILCPEDQEVTKLMKDMGV